MSQHTAGPWAIEVSPQEPYGLIIAPERDAIIAAMAGNQPLLEVMANAKLLVSAPDMWRALVRIADLSGNAQAAKIAQEALDAIRQVPTVAG